jgi:RNA polymerase sigma-32 factor
LFFNLRGAKKKLAWLSDNEAKAIAADLNVDVKDVYKMEGRLTSSDVGFDADVDDDSPTVAHAPAHYLEDKSADPAKLLEDADWQKNSESALFAAIKELDDRSKDILQSRWLADKKATLHDLAARYGVSAERIRQLENNAMKKIRAKMAG